MPHVVTATEQRECPTHGTYEAQCFDLRPKPKKPMWRAPDVEQWLRPFWSKCPTCDSAVQAEADQRHAEIMGGMTAKQMLAAARIRELGIPAKFAESTFANWFCSMPQQKRVKAAVGGWIDDIGREEWRGRCALFMGQSGCGKTHLACGMLKEVSNYGGTGHYTTADELFRRIRATFGNKGAETELEVFTALTGYDMLVVDELARTNGSDFEKNTLFAIIDARYRALKGTIIVTNMDGATTKAFLGVALTERMMERGGLAFMFDWASQRDRTKASTKDER